MAAPAAKLLASLAIDVVKRAHPRVDGPPPSKRGGRGPLALIASVLTFIALPALIVVVLLAGAQQAAGCGPNDVLPGSWTGPGSLGGVAGTGVTPAELTAARKIRSLGGKKITPGTYSPTAYLPNPHAPATNCAATCTTTASGIRVDNAHRRAYLVASNPRLNQYGALAYIWPNPYGWTGPFVVADTGSAFTARGAWTSTSSSTPTRPGSKPSPRPTNGDPPTRSRSLPRRFAPAARRSPRHRSAPEPWTSDRAAHHSSPRRQQQTRRRAAT